MVGLRPARRSDLDALRELETACFGVDAWGEEALRGELDGVPETREVVVAEESGEIVGYAALLAVGATADVARIAVRPDRRRQGLGRLLLDKVVAAARDRGCTEALLEVSAANAAAISMYEAAGFAPLARRRGYYRDGADALVLRLTLAPPRSDALRRTD
ncbi:ribosomal protein S18-alanine N-acetyltransferase [Actinopolymorpha sp. B11F2]|uniref:ribosomal protein S18-alanine N-acetyltransferase n=1 Tax=Actinopolymorpha sp. B11F2 TaxID=3160862 RepID=UPI0032E4D6CC